MKIVISSDFLQLIADKWADDSIIVNYNGFWNGDEVIIWWKRGSMDHWRFRIFKFQITDTIINHFLRIPENISWHHSIKKTANVWWTLLTKKFQNRMKGETVMTAWHFQIRNFFEDQCQFEYIFSINVEKCLNNYNVLRVPLSITLGQ